MALDEEGAQTVENVKTFDPGGLTKFAGVLVALAYVTGVIAINTYLHGLGITDFSFAKPKLLLTGALVLSTFVLLASAPIFIAWSHCTAAENKPTVKPRSRELLFVGIAALALLIFAAIMLCYRLQTPLGEIQEWWVWEHLSKEGGLAKSWAVVAIVLGIFGPGCAAAFFGFKAKRYWKQAGPVNGDSCIPLEYFHFAGAIALVLVFIIGYIMIFTFVFYPSVPVEFGGGEPYFESFAIADSQICQLQRIGIPFDAMRPGITKPLPVLHETDTLVAVWLQGKPDPHEKAERVAPEPGAPAEAIATTAATAEPEGKDADPRKNSSGLGAFQFVVVQLDQSAIVATRAYPHWKKVPALNRSQAQCKTDVSAAAGRVGP